MTAKAGMAAQPGGNAADPRLYVVTGERGSGKSTVCARVAALLRERGIEVGGVLTERTAAGGREAAPGAVSHAGDKGRREAVDLATGLRRPFGRQGPTEDASSGQLGSDPLTPSWRYDDAVFRWGNGVFDRARSCRVLIVDELGPIEILGRRGWSRALDLLIAGDFNTAIVVCRPGLLSELAWLLRREADAVYEVTVESREGLPGAIAAKVLP
jgi:nucleoside-triphosphatase THEP1